MSSNATPVGEGLLNIHKPRGLTSFDVVGRVRQQTRIARVGHAGTLDPQASGVLLVGLGKGTKLTQFLHELPKSYRATLRLGVRTDTHDAAGTVIAVRAVRPLAWEDVSAILASFQGSIEQLPPMYSALKWRGQRLYALARRGIEVERQPRRVQIFRLALLTLTPEAMTLEVDCSSGTYIRVLADDIGVRLGCGAHLAELVRTAIGPFTLEHALTLEALEEAVRQGVWHTHLIPLPAGVAAFPAIVVTATAARAIARGTPPPLGEVCRVEGSFGVGGTVAVRGPEGRLLAMGTALFHAAELGQVPNTTPAMRLRRVLIDQY